MANKIKTLKKRSEFENLKKNGIRASAAYVVLNYQLNNKEYSRLGMTISAKIGNSVTRNKLKRWTRDLFRKTFAQNKNGYDINVILRVNNDGDFFKKIKFQEYSQKLLSAFSKIR